MNGSDYVYNIAGKLKHKVDVYGKTEAKDELGSTYYRYDKIKTIYCAIQPILGERVRAINENKKGNMVSVFESIKFIARIKALTITQDMYFVYKGQRYDIDYSVPYFKDMQYQEIYTKLKYHGDENLIKWGNDDD